MMNDSRPVRGVFQCELVFAAVSALYAPLEGFVYSKQIMVRAAMHYKHEDAEESKKLSTKLCM